MKSHRRQQAQNRSRAAIGQQRRAGGEDESLGERARRRERLGEMKYPEGSIGAVEAGDEQQQRPEGASLRQSRGQSRQRREP
jgi:hypothetical protein